MRVWRVLAAAPLHIGEGLMLHWKSSGIAIFAAVGLLAEVTGPAHAACGRTCATEWSSDGKITDLGALGGLPGSGFSEAIGINATGQVVGVSGFGGAEVPTEWSGGKIINLELLPGSGGGGAVGINDSGTAVGESFFGRAAATEWSSDGKITNLGGLPGSNGSNAYGINNAGQIVGASFFGGVHVATEWRSDGSVIDLGGLPGSTQSDALSINNTGQAWESAISTGSTAPS
jgi:uncharacterized membrane protein